MVALKLMALGQDGGIEADFAHPTRLHKSLSCARVQYNTFAKFEQ